MGAAIRRTGTVKAGGVLEIPVPELPEGTTAEVLVMVERTAGNRTQLAREFRKLCAETQAIAEARGVTEQDIEEAIRGVRALRRS